MDNCHDTKNSRYYQLKTMEFNFFKNSKDYKILMLGDSITDYGSWSSLLQRDDVLNQGISGDTTRGVLERLHYINPSIKTVFLMIGINDLIAGRDVSYIFKNYQKIVDYLQQQGFKVYIQSTLYTGKRFAEKYNDQVSKLNSLLINYCKEKGITFLDINQVLAENKVMKPIYSDDDLHINKEAYTAWSKIVKRYLDN